MSAAGQLQSWSWLVLLWALLTTAALFHHVGSRRHPSSPQKVRLEHFSGWQFLTCWLIIWHHYFNSGRFSQVAYCSVTFFVFFSGFVTQYAYADKMAGPSANLLAFYLRRVGRILPSYYAAHFFTLWMQGKPMTSNFRYSVLMLCTWYGSSPETNFPAWTVCALFWCWLTAPVVSRFLMHIRTKCALTRIYALSIWLGMLIAGIIYELWSRFVYNEDGPLDLDYWFYETRHNIFVFWLGMGTAEVARFLPPAEGSWKWFWPVFSDTTIIANFLVTAVWEDGMLIAWNTVYWSGCFASVAVWVLTATLGHQSLLTKLVSHRLLSILGEYSMQIYIFAEPLHSLFLRAAGPYETYAVILLTSVAVADPRRRLLQQRRNYNAPKCF